MKLVGIFSKKVCLHEGVPWGSVLSPTLFLVYINDILTTISKRVPDTLYADDLAIWNVSEHTTTATYRIQEAIYGINKWTQGWGLEINTDKTNSTIFSLSTSKEQINLRLKDEIVPQTDAPTFLGVKLDTRLTWKPQIEKMERSSLQKLALMRKLAGTTLGADSSILIKVYTATVWPAMKYASTTWGTAVKTNKSRLDKVQNMALQVIRLVMKTTPVHDMEKTTKVSKSSSKEKNWEGCLPTLYSQTWHSPPKIASSVRAWTTSTKKCPGNTKTLDAPVELLTDPVWRPDRQMYKCFWVSQASSQRNNSLESSEISPLPWLLTDFPTMSRTRVYTDGCDEERMKKW